ncbi:MAG: UDP-glucose 4-epimerase GalE [Acidobacteriota bacterium]|nr:UDP-glucose 4-epimerase GalE [Acidobacteriota bacterium]
MKSILVTGGAGYIGSHTVRELACNGYRPISLDNLSKGHERAVVAGDLVKGELADEELLESIFQKYSVDAVMHFAALCEVGESVEHPRLYYEQNMVNSLTLLRVMLRHDVRKFILSSTCATYGDPQRIPIDELHPLQPINPYGASKVMVEEVLKEYDRAYGLSFVSLRYFNAAGASLDARLGESHNPETHLIPRILKVATGELAMVQVFGNDYPTVDGTCIRDYVHVLDLASGHVAAYQWLCEGGDSEVFNLGTGQGCSVMELVEDVRQLTGRKISLEVSGRRLGDPPCLVANSDKAHQILKWRPEHSDIETILSTAWAWEQDRKY